MTEITEYQVRDMHKAAAFMLEGIEYIRADKDITDPKKLIFVFKFSGEITRIEKEWANGTLVNVLPLYVEKLRTIKSIIYQPC